MIIGVTAAQGGIWQKVQFKKVSSASLVDNAAKLPVRFGAGGEQAGDLAVIAVTHRSNLTPPEGLTLISQQQITDDTGIVQSLSLFYIKLGTPDLGRLLEFKQVQEKRMAVAYTVQRPASIASPLTLVAFAEQTLANADAPWPAAPVTGTKAGQLIVQVQARVGASSEDMYLVPENMFAQTSQRGARLVLGARTIIDSMDQGGEFSVGNPLYGSTSVLSASVVFSVSVPGALLNLQWQSTGASQTLPTSDITESGRLWRVRPGAEPSYWHKARGLPAKTPLVGRYFEVKIEEGPAKGGPRIWSIGIARDRAPTTSSAGGNDSDSVDLFQWNNDGTYWDWNTGAYVALTPPWGVGDTVGFAFGNWNISPFPGHRMYLNGEFVGEFTRQGFDVTHVPYVCKLGPGGALRLPDRLVRLPEGCTVWN